MRGWKTENMKWTTAVKKGNAVLSCVPGGILPWTSKGDSFWSGSVGSSTVVVPIINMLQEYWKSQQYLLFSKEILFKPYQTV